MTSTTTTTRLVIVHHDQPATLPAEARTVLYGYLVHAVIDGMRPLDDGQSVPFPASRAIRRRFTPWLSRNAWARGIRQLMHAGLFHAGSAVSHATLHVPANYWPHGGDSA